MDEQRVRCPYLHESGKPCPGYVEKVTVYRADLTWRPGGEGSWVVTHDASAYHVFCSLKGNHAKFGQPEDPKMKFSWSTLPQELRDALVTAHLV